MAANTGAGVKAWTQHHKGKGPVIKLICDFIRRFKISDYTRQFKIRCFISQFKISKLVSQLRLVGHFKDTRNL